MYQFLPWQTAVFSITEDHWSSCLRHFRVDSFSQAVTVAPESLNTLRKLLADCKKPKNTNVHLTVWSDREFDSQYLTDQNVPWRATLHLSMLSVSSQWMELSIATPFNDLHYVLHACHTDLFCRKQDIVIHHVLNNQTIHNYLMWTRYAYTM